MMSEVKASSEIMILGTKIETLAYFIMLGYFMA